MVDAPTNKLEGFAQGIVRFAKLERVLASVLLLTPFVIAYIDGQFRSSISAYYDMEQNQWYYFLLTVAAMLLVVNGVVKHRRLYNVILGATLCGVILFNHDDFQIAHTFFAVVFFSGNVVVILLFSSKKEIWFKAGLVTVILGALFSWWYFDNFTLYWAETFSLIVITLHYILESIGLID